MDVKELKAGRELDVLIAEKVMGWKYVERIGAYVKESVPGRYVSAAEWEAALDWSPSTNISAAWQVVEKLSLTQGFRLVYRGMEDTPVSWEAGYAFGSAMAETAPLAICLAALKAVE